MMRMSRPLDRDNSFLAPEWTIGYTDTVHSVAESLPVAERAYALDSITWGNYPELTPEETASAALDGFEVK